MKLNLKMLAVSTALLGLLAAGAALPASAAGPLTRPLPSLCPGPLRLWRASRPAATPPP